MKKNYKKNKSQCGFTVIEMAIVILISGMLFAAFIKLYSTQQNQKKFTKTIENINIMQDVINQYFGTFGCYPNPSRLDVPLNHIDYGIEKPRSNINVACTIAPPLPTSGLDCENFDGRDVDGDGVDEEIIIGALPVVTIATDFELNGVTTNFQELAAIDGYGAKFTYAVTEKMTCSNTALSPTNPASPQAGAIKIVDESRPTRRDVTTPPASAHYVIFSHGENQEGAYSKEGILIDSCFSNLSLIPPAPAPPPGAIAPSGMRNDTENCDSNDAVFLKGIISLADNDSYYDDILTYRASNNIPIWRRSAFGGTQTWIYNANLGNVGVNTTNPLSPLDVNGNVVAKIATEADQGFCNPANRTANDCLNPDIIGGPYTLPRNACPVGEIAVGIWQSQIQCVPIFSVSPLPIKTNFNCAIDELDADGDGNTTEPLLDWSDLDTDGDTTESLYVNGIRIDFINNQLQGICWPN